eukprot:750506-Hanusia_phi.AAC.3
MVPEALEVCSRIDGNARGQDVNDYHEVFALVRSLTAESLHRNASMRKISLRAPQSQGMNTRATKRQCKPLTAAKRERTNVKVQSCCSVPLFTCCCRSTDLEDLGNQPRQGCCGGGQPNEEAGFNRDDSIFEGGKRKILPEPEDNRTNVAPEPPRWTTPAEESSSKILMARLAGA